MKRTHKIVVVMAVTATMATAFAKESTSRKPTADALDPLCVSLVKGAIAATESSDSAEQAADQALAKISNVKNLSASPCAGGAEGCMVTASSGSVTDGTLQGTFTVRAGRGNCKVEALSLTLAPQTN